jgi:glucose-6-phosphate isomerase
MDARDLAAEQSSLVDWTDATLSGKNCHESIKTFGQMKELFRCGNVCPLDPATLLYRVQWFEPEDLSCESSMLFGSTVIEPGMVGDEYFMTHGHFHQRLNRGEVYATVSGHGALILMDENRKIWMERMVCGSVHSIPGALAHRVVNTGNVPLRFVACWPADAGHDYASIKSAGFAARLLCRDGEPTLVGE